MGHPRGHADREVRPVDIAGYCRGSAVLVAALLLISAPSNVLAQPAGVTTVGYRTELGPASPSLDIYSFARSENAPVVIYVHGGVWQRGDRRRVDRKPGYFNRAGYIFVSVGYRLVPEVRIEDQLEDIDRALQWIHGNIARYGGNRENLHLMGHSAGAHLVAMTGVAPGSGAGRLIEAGALRTIIANDTLAYDVPRLASLRQDGLLPRPYRRPFGTDAVRWRSLSPQHRLDATMRRPPFLVLYSGAGGAKLRRILSQAFAERLRGSGVRVTLFDGSRYTHREINREIGDDNSVTAAIDRFLGRYAGD
jgi:acetyl esterase/lipase